MFYVIMHHMSCSVHSNKMWILRSRSSNFLSLLLRVLKSTQVLNTDHFSSIYLSFPFFVEVVNIGINHGAIFHNGKLLGFWWLVTVSKYLILNPSKYLVQEWEQLKPWVYTSRPTSKHFVSYCRERCRKTIRLRPLTGQTTVCVCVAVDPQLSPQDWPESLLMTTVSDQAQPDPLARLPKVIPPWKRQDSPVTSDTQCAKCAIALGLRALALGAVGAASVRRDWDASCVTQAFSVEFSRSITGHGLAPPVRTVVPQGKCI